MAGRFLAEPALAAPAFVGVLEAPLSLVDLARYVIKADPVQILSSSRFEVCDAQLEHLAVLVLTAYGIPGVINQDGLTNVEFSKILGGQLVWLVLPWYDPAYEFSSSIHVPEYIRSRKLVQFEASSRYTDRGRGSVLMETLALWILQIVVWITSLIITLFLVALMATSIHLLKQTRGRDISVYGMILIALFGGLAICSAVTLGWLSFAME